LPSKKRKKDRARYFFNFLEKEHSSLQQLRGGRAGANGEDFTAHLAVGLNVYVCSRVQELDHLRDVAAERGSL
jgi:hypothetical protein